jgi:hypothetical protein
MNSVPRRETAKAGMTAGMQPGLSMSERISNLATARSAEEVVTFDMRQLNDGLRMGRITSWTQFAGSWNTVMSSIRSSMVNKYRTEAERADLVSLLQELELRFQRMGILNGTLGKTLAWEAKKRFIFQVNGWHEHGQLSHEQFRNDLKDLRMLGSMHRGGSVIDLEGGSSDEDGAGPRRKRPRHERGQGRGKRRCYTCQSTEHVNRDCPNKKERACFTCGKTGHVAAKCPDK